MSGLRAEVLEWFDAKRVVPGREEEVLRAADLLPSRADWRDFLGQLALWLGTIGLAASLIFFFAYNWDDLGRFAKFGLVEAAILAALAACWRADLDRPVGKAVLVMLSLLTGALLALAGQIYQTGADTYELFAWWAVLILPWVLVGRFSPLWLFWLALINLAAILYFSGFRQVELLLWTLLGINLAAQILWETGHLAGLSWLKDSWPPRLIAAAAGFVATWLIVWAIVDDGDRQAWLAWFAYPAWFAYLAWLAATYFWYRHRRPDLFMLAGGVLSVIVAVVTLMGKHFGFSSGEGSAYLLIGLVVIGLSAGGAMWLKAVGREQAA